MTTPINTAIALAWALRKGLDNSQICIFLNDVDPTFTYVIENIVYDIPPHIAIYLPPSETDFPPSAPDQVGHVYDNNELTTIILIYNL